MGCFWCSEALFWSLKGVISTQVGYQQGTTPNPTYREVCTKRTNHNEVSRIVYDPKKCPLSKILEIFFATHDPTQKLGQGNDRGTQYRTAIYYYDDDQKPVIDACLKAYQGAIDSSFDSGRGRAPRIQTEVQRAEKFYYAEDYHQQYDAKPGNREYCGLRPLGIPFPKSVKTQSTAAPAAAPDAKANGAAKALFLAPALRDRSGKSFPVSSLNGKVIAYYHSAHWCKPCRAFTPELAKLYSSLPSAVRAKFEIVWRSYDRDEKGYEAYVSEMPWLALPYADRARAVKNANKVMPSLVVYSAAGKGITKDGVGEVKSDGTAAILKWCGLDIGSAGSADGSAGSADGSSASDPNFTTENYQPATVPVIGPESLMSKKANGTTATPPSQTLRWGCDSAKANKICCFNRHFAEHSGYFLVTKWRNEVDRKGVTTYYDTITGFPLFRAPMGRSFREFLVESSHHGWPSFRDAEVDWTHVRCLKNGEVVSTAGTHLGHNLPDSNGNRYCINLVSVAALPPVETAQKKPKAELVSLAPYIKIGFVDYLKLGTDGFTSLESCQRYAESADVASMKSDKERLAFYINAYNITVLREQLRILDKHPEYPGATTLQRRYKMFVKKTHVVAGVKMTLQHLENEVIRKQFDEPRVHFVLNCASMGCPRLLPVWLTAENLDQQLEAATDAFVNSEVLVTVRGSEETKVGGMLVRGEEKLMSEKEHGTCRSAPMQNLQWGVSWRQADKIACFNRHFAEYSGYFLSTKFPFETYDVRTNGPMTFYGSISGKPMFVAPKGRAWKDFIAESMLHGWPSFRDQEVVWDNVRVLENGETVSTDGEHLGHNLPDEKGNRYCINLVCVAGSADAERGGGDSKQDQPSASQQQWIRKAIIDEFRPKFVKDRRYHLKLYRNCFVGSELVDWLLTRTDLFGEKPTRLDAVAVGSELVNMGFMQHVVGEHGFEDRFLFYRFKIDGGAARARQVDGPQLLVSSIFKWYAPDFAKSGGVFKFITRYHKKLKNQAKISEYTDKNVSILYHQYDWRLNSFSNARSIRPHLFKKDGEIAYQSS